MTAPELDNLRLAQLAPAAADDRRGREVVFDVESLDVAYDGSPALRGVTLDIRRNDVTAFIGPSGCGKSTLIRCFNRMNDLIPGAVVSGSVRYHGRDLYAADVDPVEVTRSWAGAADDRGGARIVVEAIGHSQLVAQAVEMAGRHGEVVLLGSPRAPYPADLTPMLGRTHLLAIKLIGALEWTFPIPEATERARHTITANYRQILDWILEERLIVDPLRTHVLPPERCQEAYYGLTHHKDDFLGVVFDWSSEPVGTSG